MINLGINYVFHQTSTPQPQVGDFLWEDFSNHSQNQLTTKTKSWILKRLNLMTQNFVEYLNDDEKLILKKIWTNSLVLQKITENYKPHLLCNYLFELSSLANSWYVKYSVSLEPDKNRQKAMLLLCQKIKENLGYNLDLLGIQKIEQL